MASFRGNAAAAAERQARLAQVTTESPRIAQDASAGSADPYRGRKRHDAACEILIDRIAPDPDQPRTEFDPEALAALAASVQARGILQPIRVRWQPEADRYVIVLGERRWRAARQAGLTAIPCVVAPAPASPEEILEDQLVENCLRQDLKPIEQARAFRSLVNRLGVSQNAVAERVGVSKGHVSRMLALLDLPEPIREAIDRGEIAPDTGYLISREADPARQKQLATAAAAGQVKRDDLASRAQPRKSRGGKATPWTFAVAGVGRVRVDAETETIEPLALLELLRAALAAYRKTLPRAGRQDAA